MGTLWSQDAVLKEGKYESYLENAYDSNLVSKNINISCLNIGIDK